MKTFYSLVFVIVVSQANCQAQKQKEIPAAKLLSLRKPIDADINPHKQDVYKLRLNKGQFASIRVNQKNVGLLMLVYDPSDSLQQIVDENGIGQNEVININALITGDYKIKVTWNLNKPFSGQYR